MKNNKKEKLLIDFQQCIDRCFDIDRKIDFLDKMNEDETISVELQCENCTLLVSVYDMDTGFFYFKVEKFMYTIFEEDNFALNSFRYGTFFYEDDKCTVEIKTDKDEKIWSCRNAWPFAYGPAVLQEDDQKYYISCDELEEQMQKILQELSTKRYEKLKKLINNLNQDMSKRKQYWKDMAKDENFTKEYNPKDAELDIHHFDIIHQKAIQKRRNLYIDPEKLDEIKDHVENLDTLLGNLKVQDNKVFANTNGGKYLKLYDQVQKLKQYMKRPKSRKQSDENNVGLKAPKDMIVSELKAELEKHNVDFRSKDKKETLVQLLEDAIGNSSKEEDVIDENKKAQTLGHTPTKTDTPQNTDTSENTDTSAKTDTSASNTESVTDKNEESTKARDSPHGKRNQSSTTNQRKKPATSEHNQKLTDPDYKKVVHNTRSKKHLTNQNDKVHNTRNKNKQKRTGDTHLSIQNVSPNTRSKRKQILKAIQK